jgi:hypothetical protein
MTTGETRLRLLTEAERDEAYRLLREDRIRRNGKPRADTKMPILIALHSQRLSGVCLEFLDEFAREHGVWEEWKGRPDD